MRRIFRIVLNRPPKSLEFILRAPLSLYRIVPREGVTEGGYFIDCART